MTKRTIVLSVLMLVCLISVASLSTARAQQSRPSSGDWYDVDSVHSTLIFRIEHLGVSNFYGRINSPAGEFHYDPGDPSACSFMISLKADNVDTANTRRDGHIKSRDFFNSKQFPEITFKSTSVKKKGDRYEVVGDLSFHGVTKPITAELKLIGAGETPFKDYRCGFDGLMTIKRSEFGIDYMPGGLGEEVTIMVGLEGVKRKG